MGILMFPGAVAIMIMVAYWRQDEAEKKDGLVPFASSYAKDHWKRLVFGTLAWLTVHWAVGVMVLMWASLGGIGLLGLGGLNLGGKEVRSLKSYRKTYREMLDLDRKQWLESLGATPEARIASINEIFDRKDRTLSLTHWSEWPAPGPGFLPGYLGFRISRNLGAMEVREREMLRVLELIYAGGSTSLEEYERLRFGLLWGGGKATIDVYAYILPAGKEEGVKDGQTAIAWHASQVGASVDSVITAVLRLVEQTRAKPVEGTQVLREIEGRLTGGNTWLSPHEVTTSIFAPNGKYSLRLGPLDGTQQPLTYSGRRAVITVAPPGSGKTQCNVFPTLLNWPGPAVVLDPKGEIFAGTSKWRAEHVGPVYKFNPLDPARSNRYNPLTFVRADPDYIWEDSRLLADMIVVPSGGSDRFFDDKARVVITAAIAHTCYSNPPDARPMSQVVDIVHGGKPWDDMLIGLQTAVDVKAMVRQGTSLATTLTDKTRDSVLQVAQNSLSAWSGERISRATESSDWSPLDLRSGRNPTIYICLKPNEVTGYVSILRVLLAQHIQMLLDEVQPEDCVPILFMLDELPQLGHMPPVEKAIEIGRQYGLWVWMYAQSLGQLEEAYPNAAGLIGSCAVRVFMNPSAHDGLADKLAEELGYRQGALDGSRLRVVEASELAGPSYRDYLLVLGAGCKPARVKKVFAYQDAEITSRLGSL